MNAKSESLDYLIICPHDHSVWRIPHTSVIEDRSPSPVPLHVFEKYLTAFNGGFLSCDLLMRFVKNTQGRVSILNGKDGFLYASRISVSIPKESYLYNTLGEESMGAQFFFLWPQCRAERLFQMYKAMFLETGLPTEAEPYVLSYPPGQLSAMDRLGISSFVPHLFADAVCVSASEISMASRVFASSIQVRSCAYGTIDKNETWVQEWKSQMDSRQDMASARTARSMRKRMLVSHQDASVQPIQPVNKTRFSRFPDRTMTLYGMFAPPIKDIKRPKTETQNLETVSNEAVEKEEEENKKSASILAKLFANADHIQNADNNQISFPLTVRESLAKFPSMTFPGFCMDTPSADGVFSDEQELFAELYPELRASIFARVALDAFQERQKVRKETKTLTEGIQQLQKLRLVCKEARDVCDAVVGSLWSQRRTTQERVLNGTIEPMLVARRLRLTEDMHPLLPVDVNMVATPSLASESLRLGAQVGNWKDCLKQVAKAGSICRAAPVCPSSDIDAVLKEVNEQKRILSLATGNRFKEDDDTELQIENAKGMMRCMDAKRMEAEERDDAFLQGMMCV